MPILDAIAARASVRDFLDREVLKSDVNTLLKAAMAAPSARNIQPWHFLAITRRATLATLASALPNAAMLSKAPLAVLVAADLDESEAGTPGCDFWVQDCAAAAENLLLAAPALGLGGVWLGVHPVEERTRAVKDILRLPRRIAPFNLMALGYPARRPEAKDKYRAARVHWEEW